MAPSGSFDGLSKNDSGDSVDGSMQDSFPDMIPSTPPVDKNSESELNPDTVWPSIDETAVVVEDALPPRLRLKLHHQRQQQNVNDDSEGMGSSPISMPPTGHGRVSKLRFSSSEEENTRTPKRQMDNLIVDESSDEENVLVLDSDRDNTLLRKNRFAEYAFGDSGEKRLSLRYVGVSRPQYNGENIEASGSVSKKRPISTAIAEYGSEDDVGKNVFAGEQGYRRLSSRNRGSIDYRQFDVDDAEDDTVLMQESDLENAEDVDQDDYSPQKQKREPVPKGCLDYLLDMIHKPSGIIDWIMDHTYLVSGIPDGCEVWTSLFPTTAVSSPLSVRRMISSSVLYLIKWKDRSHWHNSWLTYSEAKNRCLSIKKLDIYIQKVVERDEEVSEEEVTTSPEVILDPTEYALVEKEMQVNMWKGYMVPEKILASCSKRSVVYALVKWTNMPYSECTWEKCPNMALEECLIEKKDRDNSTRWPFPTVESVLVVDTKRRPVFVKMEQQPEWLGGIEKTSGSVRPTLRDYQLQGLNFMCYAWHKNINAILADEMGLGKTIQSVAFVSYLYQEMEMDGPYLVVVPLSTIQAWHQAFKLWTPDVTVLLYIGDSQSRKVINDYDFRRHAGQFSRLAFHVLLTTYELLLKDKSVLGPIKWCVLVVDEAHRLKNEQSLLHRTLRSDFSFGNRLLITGTPLQNSLKELYALLSFLEPEKFSSTWDDFESEYMTPRSDQQSRDDQTPLSVLHEALKPHFLRRLKKDVEKSLPVKQERILRVDLSPLQKLIYRWILTKNYTELNRSWNLSSADPMLGETRGNVTSLLNIVNELRKASSHPYLFSKSGLTHLARQTDPEGVVFHSGKMVLLDALLGRLLFEGHRVLIFSQSVMMLDILEEFLDRRKINHCRLDGSTPSAERQRSIERFNSPKSVLSVFLLSTKAGGLGLNLQSADTVILFDSDWNPQNDIQAQARCHRIGQTKPVSIYRLVSSNTIEEEILERAKRKMVLDHLVIQRMDRDEYDANQQKSKGLNSGELQRLLMFGAKALFQEDTSVAEGNTDSVSMLHELMIGQSRPLFSSEDGVLDSDSNIPKERLEAIFTRPKAMHNLDLDSILFKAEDYLRVETVSSDDTMFLDSFKVADLSGALSWAQIIPKKELDSLSKAEQEIQDRKTALSLQNEPRRRKIPKEPVEEEIVSSHGSAASANSALLSSWVSKIQFLYGGGDCDVSMIKTHLYPRMKLVLRAVFLFGHSTQPFVEWMKKNDSDSLARASLVLPGLDVSEIDALLGLAFVDCCRDGVAAKMVSTTKVFGMSVTPSIFLKRQFGFEAVWSCLKGCRGKGIKDVELGMGRLGLKIKSPVGWNVVWLQRDDIALLAGVLKHGFGEWKAIRDDREFGLSKKLAHSLGSKGFAPTEEHLKRRIDMVFGLFASKKDTVDTVDVGKSSQEMVCEDRDSLVDEKKTERGSGSGARGLRKQSTLDRAFKPKMAEDLFVRSEEHRRFFKRMFVPVKSEFLRLDDVADTEAVDLICEVILRVGKHVDSLVSHFFPESGEIAGADGMSFSEESIKKYVGTNRKVFFHLLWLFVKTCWGKEEMSTDSLVRLYKEISARNGCPPKLDEYSMF